MKVTGTASIGGSPDVLAFDPGLRRRVAASLKKLGEELLAPEARVVVVDPTTHLVYFTAVGGTDAADHEAEAVETSGARH